MRKNQVKLEVGNAYMVLPHGASKRTKTDPRRWLIGIVMGTEMDRIPFTAQEGVPMATALYHPDLKSVQDAPWSPEVVPLNRFMQTTEDWLSDLESQVVEWRKEDEKRVQDLAEARKREAERAVLTEQAERDRAKLVEVLRAFGIDTEDGWRSTNIKDKPIYDAKNHLERFGTVAAAYVRHVATAYVRHLTLADALRLTGGRTRPGQRAPRGRKTQR